MGALSLSSLPLGFRFRPTDEELIDHYLRLKINGIGEDVQVIREVDVCKVEPWDLPDLSFIKTTDSEWFFFCPRDWKYPHGNRSNRATAAGYWKATGKDRNIKSRTTLIGMKKTLVFYLGRAPKGKRTNWVMHEYRPTLKELDGTNPGQSAYVLCRLFRKQDESIEDFNGDLVEPLVSYPDAPKSSPEDIPYDAAFNPASPSPGDQVENCLKYANVAEDTIGKTPDTSEPTNCDIDNSIVYDEAEKDFLENIFCDPNSPLSGVQAENCLKYTNVAEDSNGKTHDTSDPTKWDSNMSSDYDEAEMDLLMNLLYEPTSNPNSPSFKSLDAVANDSSNSEAQFQCGTNESDKSIAEFLNSVLKSEELTYEESYTGKGSVIAESGIYNASDVRAMFEEEFQGVVCSGGNIDRDAPSLMETTAEDQDIRTSNHILDDHDLSHDRSCIRNVEIGDQDFVVSRIMRRPRPDQDASSTKGYGMQGSAQRRICLDTRYHHIQAPSGQSLSMKMFRLAGIMVLFVMWIGIWRCLKF